MADQSSGLFAQKQTADPKKAGGGGGGLFGLGGSKQGPDVSAEIAAMQASYADAERRLIVLEERYSEIRKKLQVAEQNMLSDFKRLHTEVKTSNSEVMETRHEMDDIKGKIMLIIKELQMLARSEDVDVLRKYLDMWQPVNFVTQNEVEKMVRDAVDSKFADMNMKLEEEEFIAQKVKETIREIMQKGPGAVK
ncbi:TPA: hypothetical protein HA246_00150 [Candidatus Woesearchaeota archaeon]|nr:hypothetical protein [Candidatus Woesearchaeota archaeon]